MGVLLRGEHGEFALNNRGWAMLLRLAWDYGWRPRGTLPPEHWAEGVQPAGIPRSREAAVAASARPPGATRPWNPADYVSCRGQRVKAEDASGLAEALGAVLDDLPNHDPLAGEAVRRVRASGFPPVLYFEGEQRQVNTFEQFGGPNKSGLVAFVEFCRGGSFVIW